MSLPSKRETLDIKVELDKLREMYTHDIAQDTYNCLLLGESGTGKTRSIETMRKPVLVHSFDPGGTKTIRKAIVEGGIIVDTRFEKDSTKDPTAYNLWEAEFDRLRFGGVFEGIGTYVIDSFTTWLETLKTMTAKKQGRENLVLQLQDWQVIGNVMRDMVKLCTSLPCDFVCTGHLSVEKDEVTGGLKATIAAPPSLQIQLPILFDELYVSESVETSEGVSHAFITQNTGKYQCLTRIGRDVFDLREKPDFKALLIKAGLNAEDKI